MCLSPGGFGFFDMETVREIIYGFSVSLSPYNLFACFVGVLVGTLVGVLPGLGTVAALSLLLPLTYKMEALPSIIMLAGIYYGAQYGGSTTSILVNIPGESSSVVTCLDGYQMALQGRAGCALGIAAFGSFIAGTVSVFGIILLAPYLGKLAVKFDAPDYTCLFLLGLTMVAYLSRGSKFKAFAMATVGLLLGTIGLDPMMGSPRFTFGTVTLMDGLDLAPVAMGLFGIAEVFLNLEKDLKKQDVFKTTLKGLFPRLSDWKASLGAIGRGTFLGFFLGILPGVGAIIPTFISYAVERKISKHPERFGQGAIEGVAAPESANNAATGGALIPLLSLGIPPNVTMALLMGAFIIHGLRPGPLLLTEHPDVFWGVVTSMYTGNVMLLVLNLPLIPLWVRLLRVPYPYLFPLIILFCALGVYSIKSDYMDIVIMAIFGFMGYFMRKGGFEPAPLILGFVLGERMEEAFRQSLILARGDLTIFFRRPMAALFLVTTILIILSGFLPRRKER